jgi:phage protein U
MPVPMIDDVELKAVQAIRQESDQEFVRQRVAGLDGTLHQKLGRGSHRVVLAGVLLPDTADDDLKKLQQKAASGEEVTFTADITTALDIQKMVIQSFRAEQQVGPHGQVAYSIALEESPPLPPPAEVSGGFGGLGGLGDLGGFGLGDLGFDPAALGGVLDDIAAQAGSIMDAADAAMGALDKLSALANLADLAGFANPIKPVADKAAEVAEVAKGFDKVSGLAKELLG